MNVKASRRLWSILLVASCQHGLIATEHEMPFVELELTYQVQFNSVQADNQPGHGERGNIVEVVVTNSTALSTTKFWETVAKLETVRVFVMECDVGDVANASARLPQVEDITLTLPKDSKLKHPELFLRIVEKFPNAKSISVSNVGSDILHKSLCILKQASRIEFNNCELSSDTLSCLKELPSLRSVSALNCRLDADSLNVLCDLAADSDGIAVTVETKSKIPVEKLRYRPGLSSILISTDGWSLNYFVMGVKLDESKGTGVVSEKLPDAPK